MVSDNKTEKPTGKRLEDARKEGQVARSQDLNGAIMLGTATAMLGLTGPYLYETVMGQTRYSYSQLLVLAARPEQFTPLMVSAAQSAIGLMLPFMVAIAAMAILVNIAQVKPMITPKAVMPKLDKINPLAGFKRMVSMRAMVEVVKALLKMGVMSGCGWAVVASAQDQLMGLSGQDPAVAVGVILGVIGNLAITASAVFLVLGLVDYFYQKYEFEKQLRMSRQEVKDEHKNMEGDPQIKRKIREAGMQMARRRQLSAVKTADVVVTNPTHFAVAIQYDPDISPAPRVVAKGQDYFALKIREVAKEAGVPTVENKPLAQSLFKLVEVDSMIPPELFVTVAEVLAVVFARRGGRRGARRRF